MAHSYSLVILQFQGFLQPLHRRGSQALVYVIDSSDRRRLEESGAELAELLAEVEGSMGSPGESHGE